MSEEPKVPKVVTFEYADLVKASSAPSDSDDAKILDAQIEEAFGPTGLGLLTVAHVPGFMEARMNLLPLAREFATKPEEVKNRTVVKAADHSVGWSCGVERFRGRVDNLKGSFYANPLTDHPGGSDKLDEAYVMEHRHFLWPNPWPPGDDCPQLAPNFKACGQIMCDAGNLILRLCDRYVARMLKEGVTAVSLYDSVVPDKMAKGRLLPYYSRASVVNADGDTATTTSDDPLADLDRWCGTHNDHSTLTCLCPAIYHDDQADGKIIPCPDEHAGLYIFPRGTEAPLRVKFPVADAVAFQIGEAAQILTGGLLRATPHAVRPPVSSPHASRSTFAVFMQPTFSQPLTPPAGFDQSALFELHNCVPALNDRFKLGDDFGQFSERSLSAYAV